MVVRVEKASLADVKDGEFIGSGAMPQPDGTQKAVEVHIFAESMRGTGEGFRRWTAAGSTMTNGTAGATVTGVSGPVITVKYKGGEQKIVVSPDTPIVKYVIGDAGDLKPGAARGDCGPQAARRQLQRQPHQRWARRRLPAVTFWTASAGCNGLLSFDMDQEIPRSNSTPRLYVRGLVGTATCFSGSAIATAKLRESVP